MTYQGGCHCKAIRVELQTRRNPEEQILGACQCAFCRKHNVRAFSDPAARVTITVTEPAALQLYEFGLRTSRQVLCNRCGVYVAMVLREGDKAFCVLNIDTLDARALFVQPAMPRDYDNESREERIARRKSRWSPVTLIGWPE